MRVFCSGLSAADPNKDPLLPPKADLTGCRSEAEGTKSKLLSIRLSGRLYFFIDRNDRSFAAKFNAISLYPVLRYLHLIKIESDHLLDAQKL